MQDDSDLFAGLEINGKVIAGSNPTIDITEKTETVDNSDLFAGMGLNRDDIFPEAVLAGQGGIKEMFTGSARKEATPELSTLPEFGGTKEGDTLKVALGFLSTFDEKAQIEIIQNAIPEAAFETTLDGSTIIEVPTSEGGTRRSVINRPGFSQQDTMTAIAQVASFIPAAKIASLGKTLAQKMGLGAVAAGATEQVLQEGGVVLGREERDPTSTAIAAVTGGLAEAVVPAIQAMRTASRASKLGAATDELAQVAGSIKEAEKVTRETGIPLFQAQKTVVPTALEKQAFVAQLPAGTTTAIKALKVQNKAAGEAVESFLNNVAKPEAVISGSERARNAAVSAVEAAKRIRTEKASPLYKQAFIDGASVDLKPVLSMVDDALIDLPRKGEIARSILKVKSLISGAKKVVDGVEVVDTPSLKLLHNAKLEIDRMLSKPGDTALGNVAKREVMQLQDALLQQMDDASDLYSQARKTFELNSPPVNALKDSPIGQIAKLDDNQLKQVASKLFDPAQTNPQVLVKAKAAIKNADPDAWNEVVRVELERRLGSIKSIPESGTVENLPGQLYRALFPNDKSTKVLMAALDGDVKLNIKYLQTALSRARLGRPGGSQTAIRKEIAEELKGGVWQGVRDFIRNPVSGTTNFGVNAVTASTEQGAFNKRVLVLAKAMYDPAWKVEMKALRKLNPNSPASLRAMTQILNDIESGSKNNTQ